MHTNVIAPYGARPLGDTVLTTKLGIIHLKYLYLIMISKLFKVRHVFVQVSEAISDSIPPLGSQAMNFKMADEILRNLAVFQWLII